MQTGLSLFLQLKLVNASRIDTLQYETVLKRDVGNPIVNTLSKTEYATFSAKI